MFSCLWHDALPEAKGPREALIRDIQSGVFEEAAAELRSSIGHAAHPALVVQKMRKRA